MTVINFITKNTCFLLLWLLIVQECCFAYPGGGAIAFPGDKAAQISRLSATSITPKMQLKNNGATVDISKRGDGVNSATTKTTSSSVSTSTNNSKGMSTNEDDSYGDYGPKFLPRVRLNCECMLGDKCLETTDC